MQTPAIGRIVHITMDPAENNGADVAPAIITRVWSDTCVNVRVLADSHATDWKTSVTIWETQDALNTHYDKLISDGVVAEGTRPSGAFWPPRVGA
jgi:hypothetical protein